MVCKNCNCAIVGDETFNFRGTELNGLYCLNCYNEMLLGNLNFRFSDGGLEAVKLVDAFGKIRKFRFHAMIIQSGKYLRALEETEDDKSGQDLAIIGGFDIDDQNLYLMLIERVRKLLKRRHLGDLSWDGLPDLNSVVRGHIAYDDGCLPLVIIDGQYFSWQEFGQMIETFEGFQFRLEIFDPSEEVR